MGSDLIRVSDDTKEFLERRKQELEEELGDEPSFDEVLKADLGLNEQWQQVLQEREDEKERRPFFPF